MAIKFLYITEKFPPAGMQSGIRALEISRRLVKENIFAVILTKQIKKNHLFNKNLIKKIPSSLNIFRTNYFELKNKYFSYLAEHFLKLDFFLGWTPFAYIKTKRILKNNKSIKFLYASGPPFNTHIIGYLAKKKFNIPLVIEYRDPWAYNPYININNKSLDSKINILIEKRILQSANIIITVSPALNSFLVKKFPHIKNKPIYYISNGLNIFRRYDYLKIQSKTITFTYTGRLYGKREIFPLLKIISDLKKENFFKGFNFELRIFGYYIKPYLEDIIKKLDIEDCIFLGDFITRTKALNEITKCHLAVHIGEEFNYPTIAFKVWDYLSCMKKILYLGNEQSYTAKFLKKYDFGIIIPLSNLVRGKKILGDLITKIKEKKFDSIIDDEKLLEFTWEKKVSKFINVVVKEIIEN